MRNFCIELSFDGTDFNGWQSQPDGNTVQDIIEKKLFSLFGNVPVKVIGSSRTDAGVHARGMIANFSAPPSPYIPDTQVLSALNALLPSQIRIINIWQTDDRFHARFSAKAKTYTYVINTGEQSPFVSRWSWHQKKCKNIEAIKQATAFLTGTHDFSAFCVDVKNAKSPVRTIYRIDTLYEDDFLCITFTGDGFLYKMVRSIVGSLVAVGRDKYPPEIIKTFLQSKKRSVCEPTAPPNGLFLMKVFFKENEWRNYYVHKPPFFYR